MAGNTFGQLFRASTFGESHGGAVGVVVDGCPPGLELNESDIQKELDRRKPGQSDITSPRKEEDKIHILSGIYEGKTTGTPMLLLANNKNIKSEDYNHLKDLYRPGHADYTFHKKYGIRDVYGSGRASARETLARVAAGAIAQKYLKEKLGIEFVSYVEQVGQIKTTQNNYETVSRADVEKNIVRCPDETVAESMIEFITQMKEQGDSIGGVVRGVIRNVPVGLGEPVFDKLHADLAKAMISINAVKGFDIGSGFEGIGMKGSEHNDEFYTDEQGKVKTRTNFSGGTLGGISNGESIYFRVAFKPVSTIMKAQKTINTAEQAVELKAHGRHDPCVLPRAVPIVDAMAALVIMDHYMRHKAQNT